MSREFGSYMQGYFHFQMEQGALDCLGGQYPLTKLWGEFLMAFKDIAWMIASSEAGDHTDSDAIWQTIQDIEELQRRLVDIKAFIAPYKRVAQKAVMQLE